MDVPYQSFLCARIAYAPERYGQKIVLHGKLPDLGVEFLDIGFLGGSSLIEDLRCSLQENLLPLKRSGWDGPQSVLPVPLTSARL
jgi:hypothetical protein